MKNRNVFWFICLTALIWLAVYFVLPQHAEQLPSPASPGAIFTVTTTADSGAGSLRQAITDANANAGTDTIQFQIGTGPQMITFASALPDITQPLIIDGTTQPGYSGTPLITLSGNFTVGLKITGGGSTVKSLILTNFPNGIVIENAGGNIVTGCFIGPNFGNGVLINNSPNNRIGGSTSAERNVIGNNTNDGVRITGGASSGNIITGNYIGILADNSDARNSDSGIAIIGAPNNRVGGTIIGERNVITNNSQICDLPGTENNSGVLISGAAASSNTVEGNYIGTTVDGMNSPPGGDECNSVRIENAPNNRVGGAIGTTPGGDCTGACNVIAGVTFRGGVEITGSGATGNTVLGNFIGTNAAGTAQLANSAGVTITNGATGNTIGGTTAAARNLIADGLILTAGANNNTVQGNYIGTDTTGNVGIGRGTLFPNILVGVGIDSSANNIVGTVTGTTLGGACTGGCNLISGNIATGVFITGAGSTGNRVDYNYIGLNAAGTAALRNSDGAITLRNGANNNIIGRPMTTPPFQETKQFENVQLNNNNICVQDDSTGDYVTLKLSDDLFIATFTAVHAKSGQTSGPTTVEVDLTQTRLRAYGSGLELKVDLSTGRASASIKFPPPRNLTLIITDRNVGDSTCVRQVADNGMQTIVGTVTNGINNDPNPPHHNSHDSNIVGCSADTLSNLITIDPGDFNFICRTCNFTSFTTNSVCTRGENEAVIIRDGTDNYIAGLDVQRLRDCTSGCPDRFNREIDLHDDNTTNPPVPNPGPGANHSQNPPVNVMIDYGTGQILRYRASLNSTPNKRFRIQIYRTRYTKGGFLGIPLFDFELKEIEPFGDPLEVMTDANGNAQTQVFFENFIISVAEYEFSATATCINEVPITSENGTTSFVDVPGDTSEMSLPVPVPQPQFDFDADGKTDFAVYRAGATVNDLSYWYVLNSGDFTFRIVQFGNGGDKPVARDYHGDGVTDFAVFRPSTGTWYHSRLTGNPSTNFVGIQWGLPTDIPVPGDYDDDGATDAAVFRPSDRIWYVRRSIDGSLLTNQFGLATDKLVPADYNGDGQTDFAIYRNGEWWTSPCAGCRANVITFGLGTDDPVPGVDFNGDGADDIAVTRNDGANKIWHWLESGTGTYRVAHFGLATDKVLVGDFDADGKSDLAIFRPSEGNWYVNGSEQGFFVLRWGASGDIPIPSAQLP
jgi:hypothetical protein